MSANVVPTEQPRSSLPSEDAASPQTLFLKHFRLYPVVRSTRSAIYAVPCVKTVASSVKPVLKSIRATEPIKSVMNQGDSVGIYTLEQLDRFCPQLKTLEVHDLTDPVTRPINGTVKLVNDAVSATNKQINTTFVEPTNRALLTIGSGFTSLVYDENGKGVISSRADPIFGPINNNLESCINRYLHDIKSVPKETLTSEMSRTCRILLNALLLQREPANTGAAPEAAHQADPIPVGITA
jgi:sporulation-specific protein 4